MMRIRSGEVLLAVTLILGACISLAFVLAESAWALPFIATFTFGVAALVHTVSGKGPDEADVEEIRSKLWLRYHPHAAAEPAAAGAREAIEALIWDGANTRRDILADIQNLERAVTNSDGGSDRALAYVERVMDRQINKLRGVLSFDALIIAFLSLERQRIGTASLGPDYATGCLFLLGLVLLALVISSVMCLGLFRVVWSKPANFQDFETEHRTTVKLVAQRTKVVEKAVRLSEIAVVGAVGCFLLIELQTAFIPLGAGTPSAPLRGIQAQENSVSAAPAAVSNERSSSPREIRVEAQPKSDAQKVRPAASETPKPSGH